MAPSFFSKLVKGSATTSNADSTTDDTTPTTASVRRSVSRDRSKKPPKSRTSSNDTTSTVHTPRSGFGISTLTRGASRNRATSSPASANNKHGTDHPSHRKTESASAVPPVPALTENLKSVPATDPPKPRNHSFISVVFGGGKNNDNSSIVPQQAQPSLSLDTSATAGISAADSHDNDDDDDEGIPTIVAIASASRDSLASSQVVGVTVIPPSPLIYSSSLPSTRSTASVNDFPAAQEPEPKPVEVNQPIEVATTPTAAGTTTTASVLGSLFGRRPRTSSISSAINGIFGGVEPNSTRPSDVPSTDTAAPTPTTIKANEKPTLTSSVTIAAPEQATKEFMAPTTTGLAPGHEVQRKTSSRSLTNLPPPIIVPDRSVSSSTSSDTKNGAAHARAGTYPDDNGTVTMTPIVESPTSLKTEFTSPGSSSSRNRALSASTSAATPSTGGFSGLLSPKRGGDDDTASIISTTSKSPKDKDKDDNGVKKRLFKRSTTRKPTGLASAIAATGLAMANPSISAAHSAQMNNVAAAANNNSMNGSGGGGVTSKGSPSGTAPYMSKSPSTSAVSAGQRSATTLGSGRSPRSAGSAGRKASGGSAGRSPTLSPKKHNRKGSGSGSFLGGLAAHGSQYFSGNESEGARSRASRRSRTRGDHSGNDSDTEDEDSSSGDDSSDSDILDGLDLEDEDMPVTGFAVASNKRNADFHELFPSIPEGDYLIEDYGCALQREILIQGRLYISENHICFHANIFGWITDLSVPVDEITSLEKKMTAFVIPNAIQITTRQARYTFASFLSRDTTYDVIYNIWRLARPDDVQSMRGSIEGAGGSASAIYGTALNATAAAATTNGVADGGAKVPRKAQRKATQCACGREGRHYTEKAMEATFPGSPEMIHNLIFASGFIKDFLAVNQKLLDIQMADWMPSTEGSNLLTRNMSYIKPLNAPMGPKQTKCEIKDEMEHVNPEDYISTVTTTRTPDVPSGGVFSVKTRTCIMWAGPVSTKVLVTTQVEWTGRSFIRGIIERSAIDGQKVFHGDLEKAMRAYIQEHLSEFVPEGMDASEVAEEQELEDLSKELGTGGAGAAGTAKGTAATGASAENDASGISQEEREKQREKERNQRAWQWALDTFEGAFDVAKQSTKTALDLVWDAWDQSSVTTILYFVITILVLSNLYTLMRMGKKEDVGRRKEMMKAEEREKWVQSVVMTLWEELAAGKKEAADLREGYSHHHTPLSLSVSSSSAPGFEPPAETPFVHSKQPGSWKEEVAHLHQTLVMVEERIKSIKESLTQFEKLDGLD